MNRLTHLDESGRLAMVEVGEKAETRREAEASCRILVGPEIFPLLVAGRVPKGDVFAAARLAGIMAAKNTAQLIPLCHPLALTGVDVDFALEADAQAVSITSRVRSFGRTGVEMEAMAAAAVAALTIYDMCKGVDKGMVIQDLVLLAKSGGKSGDYRRKTNP